MHRPCAFHNIVMFPLESHTWTWNLYNHTHESIPWPYACIWHVLILSLVYYRLQYRIENPFLGQAILDRETEWVSAVQTEILARYKPSEINFIFKATLHLQQFTYTSFHRHKHTNPSVYRAKRRTICFLWRSRFVRNFLVRIVQESDYGGK